MSINNTSKLDIAMKKNEESLKNNIDKFKEKASSSIMNKVSAINSKKSHSSYNQPSADIIKWKLIRSIYFHSHASQSTKHLSYMTLEGYTLLQIQKWWDAIIYELCQYLSTNKI